MRKKVIVYLRISDKDQSHFSIEGQEKFIRWYCERNNLEILCVFVDEGQSAKSFDRPDWIELEKFIKTNYREVDQLIVWKYDRFSRNLREALDMIELIENKYGILIVSAMEPIGVHPKSPSYFKERAGKLLDAQKEWLDIKERTKFGINFATLAGRYINMAPFGYKNGKDDKKKPILIIVPEKAEIVAEIYRRFLAGETIAALKKIAKKLEYTVQGKSNITNLLKNPTYGGLVRVPEYYDTPEHLVKGIHQGIVSQDDWYKVQALLAGKKAINRTIINDQVPLRGKLLCFCGKHLTAGNSKGRKQYYWYYKCNDHKNINLPAGKLHQQMDEINKELSLPQGHIQALQKKLIDKIHAQGAQSQEKLQQYQDNLRELAKKLDNLEEKYLCNDIDRGTFKKWHERFHKEKMYMENQVAELSQPLSRIWDLYNDNMQKLADLQFMFSTATAIQKHAWIGWVFNSRLWYQDDSYRTTFLQPIFLPKAPSLQQKRLLIIEQPSPKIEKISLSAPERS